MIKYGTAALALKAFSVCGASRAFYRIAGNSIGGRARSMLSMPHYYLQRVARMIDIGKRYQWSRRNFDLLELGTGWVHWEALTTRLFFEIRADLYDVWDNRQLGALKSYLRQLAGSFDALESATNAEKDQARELIGKVEKVTHFDALYEILGFRYLLDPKGTLETVPSEGYDVVVSAGVFEHLPREIVPEYLHQTYRVLRPGGLALHSINTTDHLHLYDRQTSPKNYLRYSPAHWRLLFENRLQYINRLQRCEWMMMFQQAGFECLEESGSRCSLDGLNIDSQYLHMDRESLETTSWFAIFQKP